MDKKLKNIISLLLLLVFLLPSIIKLDHHHEHTECNAENEKHHHKSDEKCHVCDFNFSAFSLGIENKLSAIESHDNKYINNYISAKYFLQPRSLFLLRAPPILVI